MQFSEREIMNRIKRINLQFIIEMKRLSQLSPAVVKANTGCDDRTIQLMKDIKEENIMKRCRKVIVGLRSASDSW